MVELQGDFGGFGAKGTQVSADNVEAIGEAGRGVIDGEGDAGGFRLEGGDFVALRHDFVECDLQFALNGSDALSLGTAEAGFEGFETFPREKFGACEGVFEFLIAGGGVLAEEGEVGAQVADGGLGVFEGERSAFLGALLAGGEVASKGAKLVGCFLGGGEGGAKLFDFLTGLREAEGGGAKLLAEFCGFSGAAGFLKREELADGVDFPRDLLRGREGVVVEDCLRTSGDAEQAEHGLFEKAKAGTRGDAIDAPSGAEVSEFSGFEPFGQLLFGQYVVVQVAVR